MEPSRYHVSLRTLLNNMGLLWDEDQSLDVVLAENDSLTLNLTGGVGGYTLTNEHGGGRHMPVYVYHPNGGLCEGDGICTWCGRVL